MTKKIKNGARTNRAAGLFCVILGSVIFVWWGVSLEYRSTSRMGDFRAIYYNVRVLLNQQDPYNALNGEQIAMDEGEKPRVRPIPLPSEITCVYPPTALLVNVPLGFLRWKAAHLVWMAVNGGGLILAAMLMWDIAAEYSPLLAGVLIGFLLANSEGLLFQGNVAGIVVSLCVIATWCFFKERYAFIGVLCLAASLAIKPHDSGLVWLYFVFAGSTYRKRALEVLLVVLLLGVCSIIWISHVAPDWTHELRSNLAAVSAPGAGNDPGPDSGSKTIVNSDINIQSVLLVLWDEPRFSDLASYAICGALLLPWAIVTMRLPVTRSRFWIALAFVSALTMLPVYHRHHDAKLLMLAIPACALIWAKRPRAGTVGLVVTSLAIAFNADVPRAILASLESKITFSTSTISSKFITILLARPAPLAILAMAVLYLWVYWYIDLESHTTSVAVDAPCETLAQVPS